MDRTDRARIRLAAASAGIVTGALAGLLSLSAHGQTFNAETLRPLTSTTGGFSQDAAEVLERGTVNAGVTIDYERSPLILRDAATNAVLANGQIISTRFVGYLGAALGLADIAELRLRLPVVLFQDGNLALLQPGTSLATTALGDLSLGAKVALLGRPGRDGFMLAVAGEVDLATGSAGAFAGDHGVSFRPRLIGGLEHGPFRLAVDAGYGARPRRVVARGEFTMSNQLLGGVTASYAAIPGVLWALAEAAATHVLASPDGWRDTASSAMAGARYALPGPWMLQAGVGFALSAGAGNPGLRGLLSFAYAPGLRRQTEPRRAAAAVPAPAARPAPPPDRDRDRIADAADKCPNDPEDSDGFEDQDGCPDPDNDKDGIADAADKCPNEPEDKDGFEDDDGCPDPDNDKDGIADAADRCPNEPETVNGFEDEDGCPDKARVVLNGSELETLTPVLFNTDRARIRHTFRPDLDAIATFLTKHPELGRCAVEGHTDAAGPEDWNAKLSLQRANAVVKYLVDKGVDPSRLVAIGKGGALPWSSNDTEAGRATNRRVVFHIEGVSEEQKQRELEIQRQRALKRTGASRHGDSAAPAGEADVARKKPSAPAQPAAAPTPHAAPPQPTDGGAKQKADAGVKGDVRD